MRYTTLSILSIFIASLVHAQSTIENTITLDGALGKHQGTFSTGYQHDWFLGKNHKIILGIGGRFTAYAGKWQNYVTAPAQLTSNGTGPLVIFKENVIANMDTFLLSRANVYAVNLMVNLGYQFTSKLKAGFNIDVIGASFGAQRRGTYINGSVNQSVGSKVSPLNALLVSDNDRGSLNSELYVSYKFNERLMLRAGPQFLFTEYTTDTKVQQLPEPNDRFRRKSLMLMIGLGFKLK